MTTDDFFSDPDETLVEAHIERAFDCGQRKDWDKALEELSEAIELDTTNADAYFERGRAFYEKGAHAQAVEDYTRSLELRPTIAALIERAYAWTKLKQYDEAIADCSKLIHCQPDEARHFHFRGRCWHHKGEYDRALEDFSKADELRKGDPTSPGLTSSIGCTLYRKGDFKKAAEMFTEVIKHACGTIATEPDSRFTYSSNVIPILAVRTVTQNLHRRALCWKALGKYSVAAVDLSTLLEMKPLGKTHRLRAQLLYEIGQYQEAWKDVHVARGLDGKVDAEFLNRLRQAYPEPCDESTDRLDVGRD